MTHSEHAALNVELARLLGWKDVCVTAQWDVLVGSYNPTGIYWRGFSYRHADVCLPLIEWLGQKHEVSVTPLVVYEDGSSKVDGWEARKPLRWGSRQVSAALTIHECVARAVIAVQKGKS